jgi:hypothetical protein
MAADLAGPGYHINRSNLLVLESKADMQKRGSASPDDGDALALTFAAVVTPAELEDPDEDEEYCNTFQPYGTAGWMRWKSDSADTPVYKFDAALVEQMNATCKHGD